MVSLVAQVIGAVPKDDEDLIRNLRYGADQLRKGAGPRHWHSARLMEQAAKRIERDAWID